MILTKKQEKEYRKIFRKHFLAVKKDKTWAHILSWSEFRKYIIMSHESGWWTEDIKSLVLTEILEIEKGVKR